jgi:hypothetical protein
MRFIWTFLLSVTIDPTAYVASRVPHSAARRRLGFSGANAAERHLSWTAAPRIPYDAPR